MPALPLPSTFRRQDLEAAGFVGWRSWTALRDNRFADLPRSPGSYVVYRATDTPPCFVAAGSGGRFKGRDPNVPTATLADRWVADARTVYIGRATTLRLRLRTYANFGAGRPVGHWGGRYIWQLPDAADMLVAWRQLTTPELTRADEVALLAHFQSYHGGNRPFANLTG